MKKLNIWIYLLFFGSLWGLSEVMGGEFLYANDIPHASVWLSAFGRAVRLNSDSRAPRNDS